MNALYEAIMALDHSVKEIELYGWGSGDIGFLVGPKCAIGLVTCSVVGYPTYSAPIINDANATAVSGDEKMTLRLMQEALARAVPPETTDALLATCGRDEEMQISIIESVVGGSSDPSEIETFVILVNDRMMSDAAPVKRWFSDAIDLLSADLPVPAQPVVPDAEAQLLCV